jgi:hypothetical protein
MIKQKTGVHCTYEAVTGVHTHEGEAELKQKLSWTTKNPSTM